MDGDSNCVRRLESGLYAEVCGVFRYSSCGYNPGRVDSSEGCLAGLL